MNLEARRPESVNIEIKPDAKEQEVQDRNVRSVEDPELSQEVRERITDFGLDIMKDIMNGVDHTVFASTALYIHGKKHQLGELVTTPGDFDCNVETVEELQRVRERLLKVPGIQLDRDGEFKTFPTDQSRLLSGEILMRLSEEDTEDYAYPFEIFQDSFLLPDNIERFQQRERGLTVLSLEGLKRQYEKNLAFENRIQDFVDTMERFLLQPEINLAAFDMNEELDKHEIDMADLEEQLEMNKAQMQEFYKLRDSADRSINEKEREALEQDIVKLLSGLKTKIEKRKKNIHQLQELLKIEV
jgi:hypothetical protein